MTRLRSPALGSPRTASGAGALNSVLLALQALGVRRVSVGPIKSNLKVAPENSRAKNAQISTLAI